MLSWDSMLSYSPIFRVCFKVFRFIFVPKASFFTIPVTRTLLLCSSRRSFPRFSEESLLSEQFSVWVLLSQFFACLCYPRIALICYSGCPEGSVLSVSVCWLILLRLSSSWTVLPFSYSHDIGSSLALLPLLSSCHSERTRCFGYLLIVVLFFAELTSISISGCRRFGFSFSLHFSPEGSFSAILFAQNLLISRHGSQNQLRGTDFIKSFCFTPIFSGKRFLFESHCCDFSICLTPKSLVTSIFCASKASVSTCVSVFFFLPIFPPVFSFSRCVSVTEVPVPLCYSTCVETLFSAHFSFIPRSKSYFEN